MPRTKEQTVYQFDELSDRAKERARDWFRQLAAESFTDDTDSVIEDAARMADLLGINLRTRTVKLMGGGTRKEPQVYWSGFSSQGDGACFEGDYHYRKGSAAAIAAEAPATDREGKEQKQNAELNRIARELADLQRKYLYQLTASVRHTGCYSHEHSTEIEVYGRSGNELANETDAEAVRDLLRDFMRWIYRQLEQEYEYRLSDECVDEDIRANEYEFDENGNRETKR